MADHYIIETAPHESVISPTFPVSFKMGRWPNALGSSPLDAVGKPVRVVSAFESPLHNGSSDLVIISADDDGTLHLGYIEPTHA